MGRKSERGEGKLGGLVLLVVLIAGGLAAWHIIPVYYDHYDFVDKINEICRTFGIRRDWFMEMKSILGWTHDSEPFTDEEVQSRPQEDMVKDVLQMKKLSLALIEIEADAVLP